MQGGVAVPIAAPSVETAPVRLSGVASGDAEAVLGEVAAALPGMVSHVLINARKGKRHTLSRCCCAAEEQPAAAMPGMTSLAICSASLDRAELVPLFSMLIEKLKDRSLREALAGSLFNLIKKPTGTY